MSPVTLQGLHSEMNISAGFLLNDGDLQLRDFVEMLFLKELQLLSLILQFQVSHFVRILCILGCTCGAKYSLLDLAKNTILVCVRI